MFFLQGWFWSTQTADLSIIRVAVSLSGSLSLRCVDIISISLSVSSWAGGLQRIGAYGRLSVGILLHAQPSARLPQRGRQTSPAAQVRRKHTNRHGSDPANIQMCHRDKGMWKESRSEMNFVEICCFYTIILHYIRILLLLLLLGFNKY